MLTPELVRAVELQAKRHAPRTTVLPKTVLALYRFWLKNHEKIKEMDRENEL